MTEGGADGQDAGSEARVEYALRDALRIQPLDPQAMARMRVATVREWRLATGKGGRVPRARLGLWAAVAAALAMVAIAVLWSVSPVSDSALFGLIARSDAGNADLRFQIGRQRSVQAGDALRTGNTLKTHGPVLITLSNGGTLRIAAGTVMEVTGHTEALLRHGQVYVDLPPGTTTTSPFRLATRAGTVEHVGTEFEVLSNDQVVRVRVREGRVRLRGPTQEAIAEEGTELIATKAGVVSRRSISTYGRDWLWVAALAPDYEIEGRPLLGFLEWASRELGRPLKFSDGHAREVAERTILHGSVRGREPLDALASVLATTSLSYEIRGDTIWIQSGHGT
jgi:ferric-dicitrate binding protein FerR (iron transport regulator)